MHHLARVTATSRATHTLEEFIHGIRRCTRPPNRPRDDRGVHPHSDLDERSLVLVRLAALAAVDAPTGSYLMHVGPGAESGVTLDDVQDVLVAVAPVIGTARTVAAAANIVEALGFAIELVNKDD